MNSNNSNVGPVAGAGLIVGAIVALAVCGFGGLHAVKVFGRYQAVEEASNKAKVARINAENESAVNKLRIEAQRQRVLIAEQDAEIRRKEAEGIHDAQSIIAASITPLYVQLEMVRTLQEIAKDGKNATVIYIPTDPTTGIPLVNGIQQGK